MGLRHLDKSIKDGIFDIGPPYLQPIPTWGKNKLDPKTLDMLSFRYSQTCTQITYIKAVMVCN